ncbi:MAG: 16S rRNA (guanine(966)-N(2))-methyltransferase RsmD [Clostridia bacterium]|nr:16S rRNA (guanine(966)-N(2))-methyltransferase RsmD [Clostridia bacterium]
MRIVGGIYRSRPLTAPKGMTTRPTLDQVREALFNILQGQVGGARFLDLYAGSGAVGLEAVSRGAAMVVLCDQSRDAQQAIRRNIEALQAGEKTRVLSMRDAEAIRRLSREGERFDLIYLDPPYAMPLEPTVGLLLESDLLAPEGLIIAEHDKKHEPKPEGLCLLKRREYRDTVLSFYGREHGQQTDRALSGQL